MKNSGIRIEATRIISGGGQMLYLITKVTAMPESELPELYLKGEAPIVYQDNQTEAIYFRNGEASVAHIDEGALLTQVDLALVLSHIRAAGDHLHLVNKRLATKRSVWQGKAIFVDGHWTEK